MENMEIFQHVFCPQCEITQRAKSFVKKETLPWKGVPTEYEAEVYQCCSCGTEFADRYMESRNFQKLKVAFEKKILA